MHDTVLQDVTSFAPAWVRYVLALSEIARADEAWVLAARENIAIMDAGSTSAMPLWPYRELAAAAVGAEAELAATNPPPEPTALSSAELVDKILPALAANSVSVAVFPALGENRAIAPESVTRDLRDFLEHPRDVAAELEAEPRAVELHGWATLVVPELGADEAEADARLWLLEGVSEEGPSAIGVVAASQPALAFFASKATAEAFAEETGAEATPRPASSATLVSHWLLMAFTAQWDAAIVDDDGESSAVTPVRLALDLAREGAEGEGAEADSATAP